MPINKDLSLAPYFDDFDQDNQYYRVLFKPGYAVQARELTQLQTMLQNQVEQFGDNIFKEGSIVKGCNFTNLDGLEFVKLTDNAYLTAGGPGTLINVESYVSRVTTVEDPNGGAEIEIDEVYELTGAVTGLKAEIVAAAQGNKLDVPNLKTFFINYTNTSSTGDTRFQLGEELSIIKYQYKRGTTSSVFAPVSIAITNLEVWNKSNTPHAGKAFGIQSAPGIIFQKGHFLFAESQILIVSKYDLNPTDVSVGYQIQETFIDVLADSSLYDNANGSLNENAPGADRLKLVPTLVVLQSSVADNDPNFFSLVRYQNGNAITVRDVSQYNVLGEELARRTYEESGNYILDKFKVTTDDLVPAGEANTQVHVILGAGVAYVKGYRVENNAERAFEIDAITSTETIANQAVSTNYGHYVDVTGVSGHVDIDRTSVDLQNNSGSAIGSAMVINLTPTRAYLTNVRITGSISDLARISDGNGYLEVGNVIKEVTRQPLIFKTGMRSLFQTSDTLVPVRVQQSATAVANVITLSANANEDFVCDNDDILVVASGGAYPTISSVETSNNNSQLDITLDPSGGPWSGVQVYYNKRLIGSTDGIEPYDKVVKQPYIRINYTQSESKYSLGFPDVFNIISIQDSSGEDFTNSFRLNSNQKDTHYDISYIEYIQGRPVPSGQLKIQMKVFQTLSSAGEYFFTINSYPNTIESYDIPAYISDSGQAFNLRDCFDFRPICDKNSSADYDANNGATAPIITAGVGNSGTTFINFGSPLVPAANQAITTDIEYYLSRVDSIVCDSYGKIRLIKGKEQANAVPPFPNREQFTIANITIPGYPALSAKQATQLNKRAYAVTAKSTGVQNYTMKDMHQLEKKIDAMAYYISLNQLEQETQNLAILDENGLSRFKNGFVVDPFNDFNIANIRDPLFNAAIPFNRRILTPSMKTFPIDLKLKSSTGTSIFPSSSNPKVGTLGRDSNVSIINQPAATGFRNCVSNFYQYVGNGAISPPYDVAYDTTVNPVTIDIDMAPAFRELVDGIQEFIPMTDVRTETITVPPGEATFEDMWQINPGTGRPFGGWALRGFTTTREVTTTRNVNIMPESTSLEQNLGDFVRNFQFEPFIASRDIKIYMSGLRPNQRHYFFFDRQNIDSHVLPGTAADDVDTIERNGIKGQAVSTDANGVLRAVFHIPAETFFVGDRTLEVVDVNQYSSIESAATSKGFVTYRAFNFSVEQASLTVSTRAPQFDITSTTTFRNVVRRPRGRDPLAQTFFVKQGMGQGSNTVFLSQVDLYFKRVSDTNGITLQLREVVNGFPSNQIIPFSAVHKLPSDLTAASSDNASVATTFEFEAPVRLDVEKEYALVLQPDANDPNYLVFISKVGGTDLTPGDTQGASVVQDWGDGVLFSSTNNSAWKSYQDEDLKFTLRRHNFNQTFGTITLTHNDCEFFTLDNVAGRFTPGELVYQEKGSLENVSIALNATTVTGTTLDQTYSVGDYIKIQNAGNTRRDVFEVISIDSTTQITVNKPASFDGSGGQGVPVVTGHISYYDVLDPFEIHLERSSATSSRAFATATNIVGLDSQITANLSSINDINLSFVQPYIARTDDAVSTTTLSGAFVPTDDANATYTKGMQFNNNNLFSQRGVILYSKSNDPNLAKAFNIVVDLDNDSNPTSTPFVDIEISKLLATQYKISNSSQATYVSNRVELAADLDAEDINVFATGYRPAGTDIKVYIRPQHAFDTQSFNEMPWIELELFEGINTFSSSINTNDYREFGYRVPASAQDVDGVLQYTSNAGTFSGYRKFAIRIDMLSPNIHNVPTLMDYRAVALT